MSRSYKKVPCIKDHSRGTKAALRRSKRIIRSMDVETHIPKGAAWKRYVCQWDVCDWKFMHSWEDYQKSMNRHFINAELRDWNINDKYTRRYSYRDWYTLYKRK